MSLKAFFVACCFIMFNSFEAIALSKTLESTRVSIARPFSKCRGTCSIHFMRFRTTGDVNKRSNSLFRSSLTNLSSIKEVVTVRAGIL